MARPRDPLAALDAAQRDAHIVMRRSERVPFAVIGAELGISAQRTHQLWVRCLERLPVQALDQHRAEELEMIDRAQADMLARLAADPGASLRTVAEVWSSVRGWSEYKSRLLGLLAPVKQRVEVLTSDVVSEAIAALDAELAAMDEASDV